MTTLIRVGPEPGCLPASAYVGSNEGTRVAVGNDEWLLIVDDDENARDALAEILRDEGFQVATASNGDDALGLLEGHPIEIVVTDLQMPKMDGLQLLREMRERGATAPTIMMSARGTETAVQQALHLGALGFVHKPIDVQALIELVQQAVAALA